MVTFGAFVAGGRGTRKKIKTYEDLKDIQDNRLEYIITTLKPFKFDRIFI